MNKVNAGQLSFLYTKNKLFSKNYIVLTMNNGRWVLSMMNKVGKFFLQLLILIVIYQAGNLTAQVFRLQIPGNVIGIVYLFGLLLLGVIKIEQIEKAASWLLNHLGFFFIPISVGLMTLGTVFVTKGLSLLVVLIVSAFIGLLSAGKATQTVIMKKEKVNDHDHAL